MAAATSLVQLTSTWVKVAEGKKHVIVSLPRNQDKSVYLWVKSGATAPAAGATGHHLDDDKVVAWEFPNLDGTVDIWARSAEGTSSVVVSTVDL